MAAFLTQNAPGLRTSPVKRGYWVARRVLGEVIPPPPPDGARSCRRTKRSWTCRLRDMLAKHRDNPACASCHARFDSFGLTFESYGPVGEARTKDLAGQPVDTQATFPGGSQGAGLAGLQSYIRANREKDFLDNLSRKMLVYALGRSLLLSDEPLIQRMNARLAASGYRFSALVETIVTSPQFLKKRTRSRRAERWRTRWLDEAVPSNGPSRSGSHHGAAVARVPVRVRGNTSSSRVPQALRRALHGQRRQREPLGRRQGRETT